MAVYKLISDIKCAFSSMLTEFQKWISVLLLGMLPCDTFAPAAVVPQGWSAEAPNPAHLESFTSPEAIPQPLQPTAGTLLDSFFALNSYNISNHHIVFSLLLAAWIKFSPLSQMFLNFLNF